MFQKEPLHIEKKQRRLPPDALERTEMSVKQFLDHFEDPSLRTGVLLPPQKTTTTTENRDKDEKKENEKEGSTKFYQDEFRDIGKYMLKVAKSTISNAEDVDDLLSKFYVFKPDLKLLFNGPFEEDAQEDFLFGNSVFSVSENIRTNLRNLTFEEDFNDLITDIKKKDYEQFKGRRPSPVWVVSQDKVDVSKLDCKDEIKTYLRESCLRLNSPSVPRTASDIVQPFTSRLYHQDPKHSPKIISGLLNSISRDFYSLVEFAINICGDPNRRIPRIRIPLPHKYNENFYYENVITPGEYVDNLNRNGEEWFLEDYPMYIDFDVKFSNLTPEERDKKYRKYAQLYFLSCLDKASFFFQFGPTFQKILGYDKVIASDVNPFQSGPDKFNEEIQSEKILHEYETDMNEVKRFLKGWKNAVVDRLNVREGDEATVNELFVLDGFLSGKDGNPPSLTIKKYEELAVMDNNDNDEENKKYEKARQDLAKEVKQQFERYIDEEIIKPIQGYMKKLDGYTEVLTQKRLLESKVKRLERQVLDMRERGVTGSGISGETKTQDQKKVQSFKEMLARIKISDLLRVKFKIVSFVDKIASQTSRGVCLRFNVEDQLVNFIMTSFNEGVHDVDSFVQTKFLEEVSKEPLKSCLLNGTFMTPGLEQVINQVVANIQRMVKVARERGRGGKGEITRDDLLSEPDLQAAFCQVCSLQVARTGEVQKKVSSTESDKRLLQHSYLEADMILRNCLQKHHWNVFPNALNEM